MMALAGAPRATSGGNNSDRPARPAGAGGVALRRRPPGGISSLVELLFAEVVDLMAPAVWPATAAAFVLVESVGAIRGDDGDRAVTDAADGGIAPVAAAAGEIGELPGRSIKAGQILQQPW